MQNPLLDRDFLKELDQSLHKEVYAKVISLNFNESPIEQIEGKITGGSVNIDGASAVRRTCNLTMVAKELNINEFYWGLTNKFKLEIGLKNNINKNYPEIIWFKMGTYVITNFNTSFTTNNYNVSISGQDKMCLLNGTMGGHFPASIDFGKMESYDTIYKEAQITDKTEYKANAYYIYKDGEYVLSKEEYNETIPYYEKDTVLYLNDIPIKTIVREAIHTYAKEPYHNIVINDLEDYGLELLEYRGDKPLYFFFNKGICESVSFRGDMKCYLLDDNGAIVDISTLEKLEDEYINNLVSGFNEHTKKVRLENGLINYTVAKVEYGETAGYRLTDLVYPGDLISSIGETLVSILDKIKNMLGEFEYFYDIDGRFIFQRKKTYVNTKWNTIVNTSDDKYVESAAYTSAVQYSFEDNNLITSFSNNPQLNNLKNDFSVYGKRKTASGQEIFIHARFAIDKKPVYYYSMEEDKVFITSEVQEQYPDGFVADWRELIYQMAVDYYKHNQDESFLSDIIKNNLHFYPQGYTGYEQYYEDIQGFWRTLYNPNPVIKRDQAGGKYEDVKEYLDEENGFYKIEKKWSPFEESAHFYCSYYLPEYMKDEIEYEDESAFSDAHAYWNKNIVEAPELLDFWLEFLDEAGELEQFAIPYVGDRTKVVNDSKVTAIYFRETPNIIFTSFQDYDPFNINTGYVYILLQPYMESLFTISGQGKCAKDVIDELLYNHSYCIESVTLSTIPVYYLEPNARIYVHDEESKINGDYIIDKMTIPLTYNGTMSITATKAVERLY